mgnify:FL=1
MTTPFFDDLIPFKCDQGNYKVYNLLNVKQRTAFGEMGIQFMARIKNFSKPAAFHLAFRMVEWYEKHVPP